MHSGDPVLIELISESIRAKGPVSFAWFMEQALYHPRHGYYSAGRCAIGRAGDYFTNVSVGPLFGQLLAAQFVEMWDALERPGDFVIVEQGAHQGEFAGDVLAAMKKKCPELFSRLRYRIVEPFPVLRERQTRALSSFQTKVQWRDSLENLEPFVGVHFSNELFDALPVHLLVAEDGKSDLWQENRVDMRNGVFVFVQQSVTDPLLRSRLPLLPSRPAGYSTEVNLAALDLIEAISRRLERGFVLAVDYGYPREEYYDPLRTQGTLQCRAQHRVLSSPFDEIGHADITCRLDWTSVAERAVDRGLAVNGFTDQHHFITGIIANLFNDEFDGNADSKKRRALQTLLHPELLGSSFQFLAFSKNTDSSPPLSGFRLASDPCARLGLNSL